MRYEFYSTADANDAQEYIEQVVNIEGFNINPAQLQYLLVVYRGRNNRGRASQN